MSVINLQVQDSRKKLIQSNRHYSRLIQSVGTFGPYQKQLTIVVIISWFIAGIYQSALFMFYDLGNPDCSNALRKDQCVVKMCEDLAGSNDYSRYFPRKKPDAMPYRLGIVCDFHAQFWLSSVSDISEVVGLMLAGWMATKNGKKRIMVVLGCSLFIGTLALLFNETSIIGAIMAETFISISYTPMCILLLTMVPELMTELHTSWVIVLSLMSNKLGRMIIAVVASTGCETNLIILTVLGPLSIFYFGIHCHFYESPRYLMDRNILKAFEVLKKIAHKNNSEYEQVDIENSFVIGKIKIRKYGYVGLFKHRSLRIQTYAYVFIMIMMGIVAQYPSYVLEVRVDRYYQEMAMSSIQLISLLPCFLFIAVYPRKRMTIAISTVQFLLCFLFPFISPFVSIDNRLYYMGRIAVLGLVCILLSLLSVFLTVCIIETYPHTVRTLAMCLFYASFLTGRYLEKVVGFWDGRQYLMEEMFAAAALLMLYHMIAMRETKGRCFLYEVEELNDEVDEEALLE